jgi:hypothetical protein
LYSLCVQYSDRSHQRSDKLSESRKLQTEFWGVALGWILDVSTGVSPLWVKKRTRTRTPHTIGAKSSGMRADKNWVTANTDSPSTPNMYPATFVAENSFFMFDRIVFMK